MFGRDAGDDRGDEPKLLSPGLWSTLICGFRGRDLGSSFFAVGGRGVRDRFSRLTDNCQQGSRPHRFAFSNVELEHRTRGGRRDLRIDLVGVDLHQRLKFLDVIVRVPEPLRYGAFDQGFPEPGHDDLG